MKDQPKLFIEGDSALRKGFHKLLKNEVTNMPRIVMGGSRDDTIRKFLNDPVSKSKYLLIDLDETEKEKNKVLHQKKLNEFENRSFFMIQEMEGWFFTHHNILNQQWSTNAFDSYKAKKGIEINKPKKELIKVLNNKVHKRYNEINDAIDILIKLDSIKLKECADDFNNLVKLINQEI